MSAVFASTMDMERSKVPTILNAIDSAIPVSRYDPNPEQSLKDSTARSLAHKQSHESPCSRSNDTKTNTASLKRLKLFKPFEKKCIQPHDLTLLKVIGRGSFAEQVALARHRTTKDIFVIKTLDKNHLIRRKQVRNTLNEKKVLEKLHGHPFIVKLYASFQTDRQVNFVLEYCQGGELFFHLQHQYDGKFSEETMRFYAAEVLSALHEMHERDVVYRDLKPENVLLDINGHVKLADFGFAKQKMKSDTKTFSFCGSPEYLSPEMISQCGHGTQTDMWSFGCFCYELLTGSPPFQDDNMQHLFAKIQSGCVQFPQYLSEVALSLLQELLCIHPAKRLSASAARRHVFFISINWSELSERRLEPPIHPKSQGIDCTMNFDSGFTNSPLKSISFLQSASPRNDCCKTSESHSESFDAFADF